MRAVCVRLCAVWVLCCMFLGCCGWSVVTAVLASVRAVAVLLCVPGVVNVVVLGLLAAVFVLVCAVVSVESLALRWGCGGCWLLVVFRCSVVVLCLLGGGYGVEGVGGVRRRCVFAGLLRASAICR